MIIGDEKKKKALNGLRWIGVLPCAIITALFARVVIIFLNNMSIYRYLDPESFSAKIYNETVGSIALGAAFIFIGAKVAPAYKKNTAYILSVIGLVFIGMMLSLALMDRNGLAIWSGLCNIIGIGSMIYFIHTNKNLSCDDSEKRS